MEADTVRVASANADQLKAWDGDEGAYWAAHADHYDRALAGYHGLFLEACAIDDADRVLDIGCGTGQTTRDAACAAAGGSALGVDLSSAMLDHARRTAMSEGLSNVSFVQADAQVYAFGAGSFDLAISRTGAMFFGDPVAAFANIGKAVRPGGRLLLLTWQPLAGNEWMRAFSTALAVGRDLAPPPADAPGPFALSDPDRVRSILSSAGYVDISLEPTSTTMWFGDDVDDAYQFVLGQLGWMLEGLDDTGRARATDALRATMADHQTDDGVLFESAAWITRATFES